MKVKKLMRVKVIKKCKMSRKSVKARARKKLGGLVSLEVIPTGGRLIITAKKILNCHLRKKILKA